MEIDTDIRLARSTGDLEAVRTLFELYAAGLPIELGYQGFQAELATLPGRYADPAGCLLLASRREDPVGCVGLRPLDEPGLCEMKRLFVAPTARGSGLGLTLAAEAVKEAIHRGYRSLLLDTLATMTSAIALYERLGFEKTPAYYGPVPVDTIFMAKALPVGTAQDCGADAGTA